ncbi:MULTISPECIES: hypothetical protein [Streptomycetaceae]|uniref:Uncharacterized protein n=1 Tax=Kitasatospora phosalacinea TaxID=2065 RepID=A0A9W6UMY6_9ACTN|nr:MULTISPECIES: hypothetical protein [Streptomycetaceae]OKI49406.1 hypothetical protein AMK17_37735 [Streptomyces sp. CB00072]GLW53713.1 hypothetical protein Kpho01_17240 [Kitasatospora phosalacinea]
MASVLPNGATISDAAASALKAARNRSEYEEALRLAPACSYTDPFGIGITFYEKTADGHLFLRNTPLANDKARCPDGRLYFNMDQQKALFPDETPALGDGSDPNPKIGQVY